MSHIMAAEIEPPFHSVAMRGDLNFCFGSTFESIQHSFSDVQESNHTRGIFLSSHTFPCLQGPFPMPIGLSCLGVTFKDFTYYTHESSISCGVWYQNWLEILKLIMKGTKKCSTVNKECLDPVQH